MSDPEDLKRRGVQARIELLETGRALDELRAEAAERLFRSSQDEADVRENCYRTVRVIDALREKLRHLAEGVRLDEIVAERNAHKPAD